MFLHDNLLACEISTVRTQTLVAMIFQMGAGVVQRMCNGLPRNGPVFDSRWVRCKNQASRPSQGTVNGGAVSK